MRRLAALFLTALGVVALLVTPPPPAAAAVPRTPAGLPRAIEGLAEYTEQVSCDPRVRKGTAALAALLAATYAPAHTTWASTYACGTDGTRSEHYDGRAIDWMVDIHNRAQHAAATAVLHWLLAPDAAGNTYAMARRLGVMYVIYDNRMWGAWDGRWAQYNGCAALRSHVSDNACHRTHMHISLDWNGAMGRTSFWTRVIAAPDHGPCRYRDLNWAPMYYRANPVSCPSYPPVRTARGASAAKKALVAYSGAAVRRSWRGPAVSAVQRALHVQVTGSFDAATVRAVTAFQAHHAGLPVTGAMNTSTWRALLAAVR